LFASWSWCECLNDPSGGRCGSARGNVTVFWLVGSRKLDERKLTGFWGVEARGARGWVVISLSCTHPVLVAECLATAWGLVAWEALRPRSREGRRSALRRGARTQRAPACLPPATTGTSRDDRNFLFARLRSYAHVTRGSCLVSPSIGGGGWREAHPLQRSVNLTGTVPAVEWRRKRLNESFFTL
jgi:hypothetical protein